MYPYCVISHFEDHKNPREMVCKYVLRPLNPIWWLKTYMGLMQTNGCLSYGFRVIKNLVVHFFLVELEILNKVV